MDPEAPQALRLQAILVGGVVFVFSKQLGILLEDAQEMLVGSALTLLCSGRWLNQYIYDGPCALPPATWDVVARTIPQTPALSGCIPTCLPRTQPPTCVQRRLRVMSAQEAAKVTLEEGKRQAK